MKTHGLTFQFLEISHLSASMASFNRAGSKVGLEGSNAEAPQDTALDEHCLSISNWIFFSLSDESNLIRLIPLKSQIISHWAVTELELQRVKAKQLIEVNFDPAVLAVILVGAELLVLFL